MRIDQLDELLEDNFHGCAWAAFLEEAALRGGPPDVPESFWASISACDLGAARLIS